MSDDMNIGIIRRSTGKWVVVRLNDAFSQIAVCREHETEDEARAEMELLMRPAVQNPGKTVVFSKYVPSVGRRND